MMGIGKQAAQEAKRPSIRVTGLLVENGCLLVIKEVLRERTHWNLPGGKLERGETLEACLVREMREETGLEVRIGPLVYVCDRFKSLGSQIVDMSFLATCQGGKLLDGHTTKDGERVDEVRFVPATELEALGFSRKFQTLVEGGFPDKGTYQGDFHSFYG